MSNTKSSKYKLNNYKIIGFALLNFFMGATVFASQGDLLTPDDKAFLEEMNTDKQWAVFKEMNCAKKLVVQYADPNKKDFEINVCSHHFGAHSIYFRRAFFGGGLKESVGDRFVVNEISQELTLPPPLMKDKDILADYVVKLARLVMTNKFEPFRAVSGKYAIYLEEFYSLLRDFDLSYYQSTVLENIEIKDYGSLFSTLCLADQTEELGDASCELISNHCSEYIKKNYSNLNAIDSLVLYNTGYLKKHCRALSKTIEKQEFKIGETGYSFVLGYFNNRKALKDPKGNIWSPQFHSDMDFQNAKTMCQQHGQGARLAPASVAAKMATNLSEISDKPGSSEIFDFFGNKGFWTNAKTPRIYGILTPSSHLFEELSQEFRNQAVRCVIPAPTK